MNRHAAWLLDFGARRMAAVGLREVLHVAYEPQFARIPQTPPHCNRIIVVEDQMLPAWDVAAWLGSGTPERVNPLCAVVAYRPAHGAEVALGALLIDTPPRRIEVGDADACELPAQPARWRQIARSCVEFSGQAVPILDLAYMFSDALSAQRAHAPSQTPPLIAA